MAIASGAAFGLVALAGVVTGLSGYAFHYAKGTSYLSNDPRACINCHIMREEFDGWEKGSHHAHATCNDCHVPQAFFSKYFVKLEHGYRHSKGFTFQDFHEPIMIKPSSDRVVQQNCVRCHASLVGEITGHAGNNESLRCIHCHDHVGHGATR